MDDDELTRARRALRGADPELDLRRVYAQSRARATDVATGSGGTGPDPNEFDPRHPEQATWPGAGPDDWPDTSSDIGNVEVLLRDAGAPTGQVPPALRHGTTHRGTPGRRMTPRGRALAWSAAAVTAAVLAVSLTSALAPGALPGSAPGPGTSGAVIPEEGPSPSPTVWMTPGDVVARAGKAMSGASCGVKTRSTLGDDSALRFDPVDGTGIAVPKTTLDQQPLEVLQAAAAAVVLGLPGYDDSNDRTGTYGRTDQSLAPDGGDAQELDTRSDTYEIGTDGIGTDGLGTDDVHVERAGGQRVARIQVVPTDAALRGGVMTRVELLVDTTTWLPSDVEIWAEADGGKQIRVHSELSWAGCNEPSMSPTYATDRP
ncbi:hypothetical protein ACH47X_10940 [Promicromonospora kroppenstedtii]|uniref:Uncharacterized protein n=1 Tax=Promicromonospora kroppenstedtii TaxID=440482 RepID=A0ABW7XIS1_9MICO